MTPIRMIQYPLEYKKSAEEINTKRGQGEISSRHYNEIVQMSDQS